MNRLLPVVPIVAIALAGCKNSVVDRSLIFSTNTSLGLEVAVNPSGTEAPAKILIGYKRAEGVLDPVYQNLDPDKKANDSTRKVNDYYLPDAYSVLAKFQGTANASGGASSNVATTQPGGAAAAGNPATLSANVQGGMTLSQWFATGEAAKILARYGGGALSDNPGVSAAVSAGAVAASERHYGVNLAGVPAANALIALEFAYDTLKNLPSDANAQKAVADLDSMASSLIPDQYKSYTLKPAPAHELDVATVSTTGKSLTFRDLLSYRMNLLNSIDAINSAFASGPFTLHSNDAPPADIALNVVQTDATGKSLTDGAAKLKKSADLINQDIQSDPAVIAVFQYFVKLVTQ